MFPKKLTLVGLVAVLLGVGLFAMPAWAYERTVPQVRRNAPVPKADAKEGRILFWLDGKPQLLKPDGTELEMPDPLLKKQSGVGWGTAKLSPDGKKVVFQRPEAGAANRKILQILDLDGKEETKELTGIHPASVHWLGGGKKLCVRGQEVADEVVSKKLEYWVYDLTTDKKEPLKVPDQFIIRALSPDGKVAVADEWKHTAVTRHQRVHLWTIGTDEPTPLLDLNHDFDYVWPAFSPDGKRLLCKVSHYAKHTPQGNWRWLPEDFKFNHLVVIDLATKKQTVLKELAEAPEWGACGFGWSPDGKKIAYVECKPPLQLWQEIKKTQFRVMVADPDGSNEKKIYEAEGSWLVGFDWK